MSAPNFSKTETTQNSLRALFENNGFRRTTPGKFEEYSLYMDNRNFLDTENAITFMNMDGRLMSLKADVTLSIVKNISKKELPSFEKLYYMDEVYRASKETHDYKVLSQIGVEIIGSNEPMSNLEAISLALQSLKQIDEQFVLDISHLGIVTGLFENICIAHSAKSDILSAIHTKSTHEVRQILNEAQVAQQDSEKILELAEMHGPFHKILPRLEKLCVNDKMISAYRELSQLSEVIDINEAHSKVFIDFSVVSDLDYYNGLLFLGYVNAVPKAILSGGRYDNLLKKMGKKSCAIGFGISLSELGSYRKTVPEYDFDMLLLYSQSCDKTKLLLEQKKLIDQGKSVRLEPDTSSAYGFSYRDILHFSGDKFI